MARPDYPQVITANGLLSGAVLYLTAQDTWSEDLASAEVLSDPAHAEIRLIDASQRADEVVGVYLADVTLTNGAPTPVHFREDFRRLGPSNYAHGKQASQNKAA